jgi:hypothetical protein
MKEDNSTEQVGSLKKRELCRGKKPHDFQLVMPDYLVRNNPDLSLELVEKFYESEQRIIDFTNNESRELGKLGVFVKRWNRPVMKYYQCSVCGKKEWDLKINK